MQVRYLISYNFQHTLLTQDDLMCVIIALSRVEEVSRVRSLKGVYITKVHSFQAGVFLNDARKLRTPKHCSLVFVLDPKILGQKGMVGAQLRVQAVFGFPYGKVEAIGCDKPW